MVSGSVSLVLPLYNPSSSYTQPAISTRRPKANMEAGPEIPPHILARRKRKAEGVAAALAAAEAVAAIGASLPEQADREQAEKRPRVIGPAPPPAPLGENPKSSATEEEEESSDDEGIGPALPSGLSPEVHPLLTPHIQLMNLSIS